MINDLASGSDTPYFWMQQLTVTFNTLDSDESGASIGAGIYVDLDRADTSSFVNRNKFEDLYVFGNADSSLSQASST